MKATILWDN